jgi:hypothetical protein
MTLPHQDPVIAGALARVPVPPPSEDFWARLEGRLAPLDEGRGLPPVVAPSVPRQPGTEDVVRSLLDPTRSASPRPVAARRWPWRVLAAAAAAFVVVAIVVSIGRDPTSLDGPGGLPPVTASPTDVLAAYKGARDRGDDQTAAALLGPRISADVATHGPGARPYVPASERPPARANGHYVEWPDDWPQRTTEFPLTEQATLVAVHTDSPYLFTFVMWREDPGHRWLVEGFSAGPNRYLDGDPAGLEPDQRQAPAGNGQNVTVRMPTAGHAWVFIDGILYAERETAEPVVWRVPPVPATSSDPGDGRDVITVFVGPQTVESDGTHVGGPN